ncbi:MAG: anti-sigma factor [Chloroflexi bacterium]|nr:MAG: anti-sigma factor [Chloroflexota bacterium]
MKDLRSEVRAAFEKEQAPHPPAANLRPTILRSVTERPTRTVNLQWLAAAAVLLITALVVASLVSSRALRNQVPAHASPAPTVRANGDYGPPPAGVPLFYLKDPDHPGWYVGFDWGGTPRATLKLPPQSDQGMSLSQSADGSYFIFRPGAKGGGGQFYDRLGKPLAGNGGFAGAVWADDNSHQCGMAVDENTGKWILATQQPGQPAKTIATVAPYSVGEQAAIELLACSYHNDRAVLERIANSYPTDLWVIQLSDGKVLKHTTYSDTGTQLGALTASPDGSLVALNSSKAFGGTNWFGPTTLVRASDGALVAKLDPSYAVLGFSRDTKTVLVTTSPWVNGSPVHLAVLDIASGNFIWRYDGPEFLGGYFTNPAGSGFAVMFYNLSDPGGAHPTVDVVIVTGTSEPLIVPRHYQRA